ncbi:MAG: SDR family NAD(P)-dependent oxidoreductase [Treponema sp.]|nr:SDR family NAD(P)-dependent oxidoreductase [Treponema sp.]MCL2273170.1 SDR family NAD(P)-dependent oxidoreductase [Treponema sp.]
MKDIRNKVILITGGGSGIGRIMAFSFAEKQARVIIWDVNRDAIKTAEDEAQSKNLFIKGMICDVSNPDDVCAQAKKLTEDFGHLDILINNAGIVSHKGSNSVPGPLFLSVPDERIRKTIEINTPRFVRSVFFLRILPVQALDFAANITGISHAMDDFKGRT